MKKTKQGTKKNVVWRATCTECGSEFEEEVGNFNNTESDRDGEFARTKCPDCKSDMFFYPPASNPSQFGDH